MNVAHYMTEFCAPMGKKNQNIWRKMGEHSKTNTHEELDSGLCMCVYLCVCAYRSWDQGRDQNLEEALKDMGNRRWRDSYGKTAEVCVCVCVCV